MKRLLCLFLLLLPASLVQAQGLDIGLVSGNEASLPIVVVPMPYQGHNAAPDTDVADVIRKDLNRSGQFMFNVTSTVMTYALGRGVEYYDAPAIRAVMREAAPQNRLTSIIVGIVKSTPFQMRRSDS